MQRDKIYGLVIFIGAAVILLWYTLYAVVYAGYYKGNTLGPSGARYLDPSTLLYKLATIFGLFSWWGWAVILPLFVAALLILVIAMWIGWTMLTTPPPVPLEELEELGLEEEEEEDKGG
ncbi:MAG: hypothetical protein ACFFD2_09615 [Promethearchaeota archaeon]